MVELTQQPTPEADIADEVLPDRFMPTSGEDPLQCNVPMPHRAVYYPFGFATEVVTNNGSVLPIVEDLWGAQRKLHDRPMIRVRILVSEGGSPDCPPPPVPRAQGTLFTVVADAHNHALCDLNRGVSVIWIKRAALQYPSYLQYHFIETSASLFISTVYTSALHAGCVSRHGHGMLLTGNSGAGKSTLSYACARAGWTFTSDDGSFLLHDSDQPRVIGNCRMARFRPHAKELFPELQKYDLTPRPAGKPSIEIPTSELGLITAEVATVHSVILLNRQHAAVTELLPLPRSFAIQRFRAALGAYPEEVRGPQIAALQKLSAVDVYELRYWDLPSAIARLDRLARGVETPAPR